jgi:hypothetical protein
MLATMSIVYIPCEVREGLFSNEYAVTVRDINGDVVSFFADRGLVKAEQRPLLRVRFVGKPDQSAGYVVMLPGSAMDAEQRYLRIREEELVAA